MTKINLRDRQAEALTDYYSRIFGTTTELTASDTATPFPASILLSGTDQAKTVMISVENAAVRYAINATPSAAVGATPGFGHVIMKGGWVTLSGTDGIANLLYVNSSSGVTATLMVTPEF